uniref:Uncharacterized protein n=1 Tax=Opuntia streptacantha TaxID=393608 RepID=A0A7C8YQQ8_OPUST
MPSRKFGTVETCKLAEPKKSNPLVLSSPAHQAPTTTSSAPVNTTSVVCHGLWRSYHRHLGVSTDLTHQVALHRLKIVILVILENVPTTNSLFSAYPNCIQSPKLDPILPCTAITPLRY